MKVVDLDESTVEYQNPYVGNDYPGVVSSFSPLGYYLFFGDNRWEKVGASLFFAIFCLSNIMVRFYSRLYVGKN